MQTIADKLSAIAGNMDTVYYTGYNKGFTMGYDKATYDGAMYYDSFWDTFQQNGERKNYEHAFAGKGWYKENMNPKYDITPSHASNMFLNCEYQGDLRNLPVKIDFSQSASMANLLGYCYGITGIGEVNASKANNVQSIFTYARVLETVEKLKLNENGTQEFGDAFKQCYALKNIIIEGKIGYTVNLQWSTMLSRESIESIINALTDVPVKAGASATFSYDAVGYAFDWDFAGAWSDLIATKPNWTISIV